MSFRLALLCAAAVTMSACDSTDVSDPGSIDLSLGTGLGTAPQGGSIGAVATVVRDGGFEGNVSFGVTGAPTGVTVGVNGFTRTGETTTALITFAVAADVPAGVYPLTVNAIGDGVNDMATFSLTVSAVTGPNYSIGIAPSVLTVVGGLSGIGNLTLTRTGGFVGVVHPTLTGAPAGVTATFAPTDMVTNLGTMTVAVSSEATPGVYSVFVTGTAGGLADKSYPFTLVVKDPATVSVILSAPAALTLHAGGTAPVPLTLTRTGDFEGAVTLTATGMPAGMTVSFDPSATTASASVATFATTAATATGNYPIIIHASASGVDEATITITVSVIP